VRTNKIASQNNPAHANTHISRGLYLTCMKYNTTIVALNVAIIIAM